MVELHAARHRRVGPYTSASHRRRYLMIAGALTAGAVLLTALTLTWGNSQELWSTPWWRIANMRLTSVIVIAVVTFCQAFATVTFQTVAQNRIITPSIMGFEAMYVLIQTVKIETVALVAAD